LNAASTAKHQVSITILTAEKPYSARVHPLAAVLCLACLPVEIAAGPSPVVPVRVVRGFPIVDRVFVDGVGPFRFLLDTGAESSAISPELARRLGLRASYAVIQVTAAAERAVPAHIVNRLTLGVASAGQIELIEAPMERVGQAVGRVDGVLGQNFLGRFAWLLDFEGGTLRFDLDRTHRARHSERRIAAGLAHGRLTVPVQLGGETLPLALDSAASHVILFFETKLQRAQPARLVTGAGGKDTSAGRLRRLSVGGVHFENLPAALAETRTGPEKGLLPANLFRAIYADAESGFVVLNP
jgi:predicted aspartyl protease